jgi:hypothetical protein
MTRFLGSFTVSMLAAGIAVIIAGCHVEGPMGSSTTTTCTGTADDMIACTVDACPMGGVTYTHQPQDSLCASNQMCDPSHGCVARSPVCPASCDDSVACTADTCDATTHLCVHALTDSLCASGQECSSSGCVSIGPPPAGGFHCVWTNSANRIGYAVRVRATGMTGVRTIPDSSGATMAMSGSHIRLWALGTGAAIDDDASGWATYSLVGTPGGRINTHPFIGMWRIGADPAFNRDILNIANLQADGALTAHDLGLEAQVCLNPSGCSRDSDWVELPQQFYVIDVDTVDMRFSNDPNIAASLRGEQVMRAVLFTDGSDGSASCAPVSP